MERKYKIIASLASIIPAVVMIILIIYERVRIHVRIPFSIDVFLVTTSIIWWIVVLFFNYIIWKDKLQIEKPRTNSVIADWGAQISPNHQPIK